MRSANGVEQLNFNESGRVVSQSEGNEKKIKDICSPGQHLTDTGQENQKTSYNFFVIYRERYTR